MTPIYEALMKRIGEKNGKRVVNTKIGGLLEISVEPGSAVGGD